MSISVSHCFETDVDIRNTKKLEKLMKRMTTSISYFSETDVDIRNTKKKQKKIMK